MSSKIKEYPWLFFQKILLLRNTIDRAMDKIPGFMFSITPRAVKRPKDLSFRRKIDKIPPLIEKKVNLQNNLWWNNGMISIVSRKRRHLIETLFIRDWYERDNIHENVRKLA